MRKQDSPMDDVVVESYKPSDDEPFMNERQREYFRRKLIAWRESILAESNETLAALQKESENHPDFADRASSETDRAIELRARDRQRKLIAKIEAALARIDDGSYGFCVETGDPISLRRLDARPIATLSVEAQERHERREKIYRDEYNRGPAAYPRSWSSKVVRLTRRVVRLRAAQRAKARLRGARSVAFRGRAGAPFPLPAIQGRRTDRRPFRLGARAAFGLSPLGGPGRFSAPSDDGGPPPAAPGRRGAAATAAFGGLGAAPRLRAAARRVRLLQARRRRRGAERPADCRGSATISGRPSPSASHGRTIGGAARGNDRRGHCERAGAGRGDGELAGSCRTGSDDCATGPGTGAGRAGSASTDLAAGAGRPRAQGRPGRRGRSRRLAAARSRAGGGRRGGSGAAGAEPGLALGGRWRRRRGRGGDLRRRRFGDDRRGRQRRLGSAPGRAGASRGEAWLFSRAGVSARLICDSTTTSFGPPIMTRCSTLSRRTRTSCR